MNNTTTNQPTNTPTTPTQDITMKKKSKIKANMATLGMSARAFADYAQEKGEAAIARNESYNKGVMSAAWELKLAIGNKRKDIENLVALQFVKVMQPLREQVNAPVLKGMYKQTTPAQVLEAQTKLFASLPKIADAIEALYAQYSDHEYVIGAKTGWEFELHPFTRQISFAQQADAQAVEHESVSLEEINNEFALDDMDADEYSDEYQAAFAAWGANSEMDTVMRQSDKSSHKENNQINEARTAGGDINDKVKPTYENIDRAGWIEDMEIREFSEWLDAASWGARAANLSILGKALKRNPEIREVLVERKRDDELTPKTLGSMTNRFRTQEIVLDLTVDRLNEYLLHAERAEEDSMANIGIQMPQNDRLIEARDALIQAEDTRDKLMSFNQKLWDNETFMIRDEKKYGPAKSLSLWRTFDLKDEVYSLLSAADRNMMDKVGSSSFFNPDAESDTKTGLQFWSIELSFAAPRAFRVRVAAAVGVASRRNYHTEAGKAGKLAAEKYLAGLTKQEQSTNAVDDLITSLIG